MWGRKNTNLASVLDKNMKPKSMRLQWQQNMSYKIQNGESPCQAPMFKKAM